MPKRLASYLASLPCFALLVGLAVVPVQALPFDVEGLTPPAVELAQFRGGLRGNTGGDGIPSRGGGGRFPGRGGFGINPGIFLPPLIDAVWPRGPVYVEEEYDEPRRPRRRPKKVQARAPVKAPVARAAPQRAQPPVRQARPATPRIPPVSIPVASERRYVPDEVLIELRDAAQAETVLRRHQLTALGTTRFSLPNASIIRARVEGGRSARQVLQQIAGDARIATAQPNYLYTLQEDGAKQEDLAKQEGLAKTDQPAAEPQKAAAIEPPATPPPQPPKPQYVLDKLSVEGAHRLARGAKVKVALIDTGLDDAHPELNGVIAGRFDALGSDPTGTLEHGTAMAGAIVAKATLRGVSPGAELLAARAFGGPANAQAQGTSFQILQSLDWAAEQGARVFNLSFAGPQDRLLGRSLDGAKGRKIIAIAAVGNAGPGTAPLYPAAEPSVLAVTATDANDTVFPRANTGAQVAIAAPGVDVIAAAPEGRYAFSSGTSIAAAHVSGLVALMVERNPDLDLAGVKRILAATALDLGAKGADPIYGAGRADAAAAVARASEEVGKK